MNNTAIKALYHSLSTDEKHLMQQCRQEFERCQQFRFINLESYITHLATGVITRQRRGEFVPQNIEEAKAGYYL